MFASHHGRREKFRLPVGSDDMFYVIRTDTGRHSARPAVEAPGLVAGHLGSRRRKVATQVSTRCSTNIGFPTTEYRLTKAS
jgi:hypothetical protein